MAINCPARIGDRVEEVETPALLIDVQAAERNIKRLQEITKGTSAIPRPHAKSHKCPNLARMQIKHGAIGVCCQKVSEAVALVNAGITDVLVANQIVDHRKIRRLSTLARRARISVCVDQKQNVVDLSRIASSMGTELYILIEIDVGMKRCGVQPGPAVLSLAKTINEAKNLKFVGLQAYQGAAQHLCLFEERLRESKNVAKIVAVTVSELKAAGIDCPTISGGGTGTCRFDAESGVYTEIQAGSYVVMDVEYGDLQLEFENSLYLWSQVMSTPNNNFVVIDAGLKAFTVEKCMPKVSVFPGSGWDGITVTGTADEHSIVNVSKVSCMPKIGEKMRLIVPHCDPAVNLHDWLVCISEGKVIDLWPISARGPGL